MDSSVRSMRWKALITRYEMRSFCEKKLKTIISSKKTLFLRSHSVPWCNWQHVWLWIRRVQVRPLAGQQANQPLTRSKAWVVFLFDTHFDTQKTGINPNRWGTGYFLKPVRQIEESFIFMQWNSMNHRPVQSFRRGGGTLRVDISVLIQNFSEN